MFIVVAYYQDSSGPPYITLARTAHRLAEIFLELQGFGYEYRVYQIPEHGEMSEVTITDQHAEEHAEALAFAAQLDEVRALVEALVKWNSVDGILVSAFAALERTQHLDWVREHWPNICEAGDVTRAALAPFEGLSDG